MATSAFESSFESNQNLGLLSNNLNIETGTHCSES